MSPTSPGPGFSRRRLLAGSAAGVALLVAGCTPGSATSDPAARAQAAALAAQVRVQEALVAAYRSAAAADAALGAQVQDLAAQADRQLARLRAAAPSRTAGSGATATPTPAAAAPTPPAGQDVQGWLRGQVTAAADSHATACVQRSGAAAALLGSIAAGLRGQATLLA
jgi:hypothetical protein